jgi:hypothetical protein
MAADSEPLDPTQPTDEAVERESLGAAARAFLAASIEALREVRVLPTPFAHPYIQIGRDYFGDDVAGIPEFAAFEQALEARYPDRFSEPQLGSDLWESTNAYTFSLLEAVVARCGLDDREVEADSEVATFSINELIQVLDAPDYAMVCCREVSHLTTADGEVLQLGDVTIIPEDAVPEFGGLTQRAGQLIPGLGGAFNRVDPRIYDPPKSLLVVRREGFTGEPYAAASAVSASIDMFLIVARLIHASTSEACWQACGIPTLVSKMHPLYRLFEKGVLPSSLVRRTTRLSAADAEPFRQLSEMLNAVEVKREGMATTSFDLALDRYLRTFSSANAYDNIIDLATALEALLTGSDAEAVGLRLKSRAAALLFTEEDTSRAIFDDVGRLYSIRSTLVHGASLKQPRLLSLLRQISTTPQDAFPGTTVWHAVDRLRDIVRRAFLARMCLAEGDDPVWPINKEFVVDALLATTPSAATGETDGVNGLRTSVPQTRLSERDRRLTRSRVTIDERRRASGT